MPTTLELAGITPPPQVEFHSLLPLLRGKQTESNYPAIYVPTCSFSARSGWMVGN